MSLNAPASGIAPLIALLLLLGLVGCSPGDTGGASHRATGGSLQGAVVILLDTVRADHLSCYGYERKTSPHIDQLASEGVTFEQVVSAAPWTRPSISAMLAGEYPAATPSGEDAPMSRSLVETLRGAGLATAAFTEGGYVSRVFGMDRGFATFVEEEGVVQLAKPAGAAPAPPRGGIENTFAQAQAWLAQHKDQSFFLFIHTYEPHAPYTHRDFAQGMSPGVIGGRFSINLLADLQSGKLTLKPSEVEYVKALYDGDILYADAHVGAFVQSLAKLGLADRTLVVVTSDHGEELGDRHPANTGDHGHALNDYLLLVPLVIKDPLSKGVAKRIVPQVRTIDIMPTIADALGVTLDHQVDGGSLLPLVRGVDDDNRPAVAAWTRKGPARASLRDYGFKYMETIGQGPGERPILNPPPPRELYDLREDPGEQNNLLERKHELAGAMRDALSRWRQQLRREQVESPQQIDAALHERLKALGYIK